MNIADKLNEWTDLDIAMHEFAIQIGIIKEEDNSFTKWKWVYWTQNKYSVFLNRLLKDLIDLQVLEINNDGEKVRFNKNHRIES